MTERSPRSSARRQIRLSVVAGMTATAVVVAFVVWLAARPVSWGGSKGSPYTTRIGHDTAGGVGQTLAPETTTRSAEAAGIVVANPADSLHPAAFAVELTAANTEAGAILKLRAEGAGLPAPTYAPKLVSGVRWYAMLTGAFPTRSGADSLVAALRQTRRLDLTGGTVVRTPYAFRIDSGIPLASVKKVVTELTSRDVPAYALDQGDGTAVILVGAFENPAQSTLYAESAGALGATVTLVFRKGRIIP